MWEWPGQQTLEELDAAPGARQARPSQLPHAASERPVGGADVRSGEFAREVSRPLSITTSGGGGRSRRLGFIGCGPNQVDETEPEP